MVSWWTIACAIFFAWLTLHFEARAFRSGELSPAGVVIEGPSTMVSKRGAGVLAFCGQQVLLARRTPGKSNGGTWGLPGGNADREDQGDLRTTAMREAREELGPLPRFEEKGAVLTVRGVAKEKEYTVFVCEVDAATKESWTPQLDETEHVDWAWHTVAEIRNDIRGNRGGWLHPVVYILFSRHEAEVLRMMGQDAPGGDLGSDEGAPTSGAGVVPESAPEEDLVARLDRAWSVPRAAAPSLRGADHTADPAPTHQRLPHLHDHHHDHHYRHHHREGPHDAPEASSAAQGHLHKSGESRAPEKTGAGLLIACGTDIFLMRRHPESGNGNTWGIPGGNQDPEDNGDLRVTAWREAHEEMDPVPELTELGHVLAMRGKHLQKHYTVFVCRMEPQLKDSWHPTLDPEEHTEWRWFALSDLLRAVEGEEGEWLHPVVRLALGAHRQEVKEMLSA